VSGHDVEGDPDAVRAVIGVTGQFSAVDEMLTGQENMMLMARLRHLPREVGAARVRELLERFDLTDAAGRSASTYSAACGVVWNLAMTLVGAPSVDLPPTSRRPALTRAAAARCGTAFVSWLPAV